MRMPIRPVLAFLVCFFLVSPVNAQFFPKLRAKNADGCVTLANGKTVCPLAKAAATVATAPMRAVAEVIDYRTAVREFKSNYASVGAQSGYGSSGSSVAGYGSSGSSTGYGSSGTQYGRDYDGAPITSYGPLISQTTSGGVCDCCCPDCSCNQPSASESANVAGAIGKRRDFRRELLSQAKQALADGRISEEEYRGTERILRVPGVAMMLEARAGTVDWATLFEKLLPIILELIKLLSAKEVPLAAYSPESFYVSFPITASTIESFEPLPLTI